MSAAEPERIALWTNRVTIALLAASVIVRALTGFTKPLVQDDFYWAYLSWLRSTPLVPGRDYYLPNVTPLSELAAPLFRLFPESFVPLLIARAVMLAAGFGLLWATYRVCRLLGASVTWSLAAIAALSWQAEFLKRIDDVRGDAIAALFLMLAVTALLTPNLRHRHALAGAAYGAAIVFSYKIGTAAPFIGIGAIVAARRRLRDASVFVLSAAAPVAAYFAWRIAVDGYPLIRSVFTGIFGALSTGISYRWRPIGDAIESAPITSAAIVAGFICLLMRRDARTAYALLAAGFIGTFIDLNRFFFPYNFVIVVPVLTPMIAGLEFAPIAGRARTVLVMVVVVTAAVCGSSATADLFHTKGGQQRIIEWIWSTTTPRDAVFDWQGSVPWRPSTAHWFLFSGDVPRYRAGWFSAEEEIRLAQVKLALPNYRLSWMTPNDAAFFKTHFVAADTCIDVPGWIVSRAALQRGAAIDAFLDDDEYVLLPRGASGILLDGQPIVGRQRIARGPHVLRTAPGVPLGGSIALLRLTRAMEATAPPCRGESLIDPAS